MTTHPTITGSRFDSSINDTIVDVEPYRTTDRITGEEVEVTMIYGNGGLISAEGFRVKKDGQLYARRQTVFVEIPQNVREALGR